MKYIIIFLALSLLASTISSHSLAVSLPVVAPTPVPVMVEYVLPYPGMLPDNPLYFLKNVRDQIIELLISDPVRKAEFYLLQADKKLSMGITLSDKGKSEEAKEILVQAFSARKQAQIMLTDAVKTGRAVPAFIVEKLILSLQKHKEVLSDLKLRTESLSTLFTEAKQLFEKTK